MWAIPSFATQCLELPSIYRNGDGILKKGGWSWKGNIMKIFLYIYKSPFPSLAAWIWIPVIQRGSFQETVFKGMNKTRAGFGKSRRRYPHPKRGGVHRSLTSHLCTVPSDCDSGIPTPPERIRWPRPWRSAVSAIKTTVMKWPLAEFIMVPKMQEGVNVTS